MRIRLLALLLCAGAMALSACHPARTAGIAVGSHHPARTARMAASPGPCAAERRLRDGVSVPGWRMGAIQFLSPSVGVAVTAGWFECGARQSTLVPARLWLAVSRDGGASWQVRGRALPTPLAPHQTGLVQHVVATSTRAVWAVTADGLVLSTVDGGASWSAVPLPRPVVQLTQAEGYLWALSCPQQTESLCHPVLERARPGGAWARRALPRRAAFPNPSLTVSRLAVIVYAQLYPAGRGVLIVSRAGRRFVLQRAPHWSGQPCTTGGWLASAGRRTWLLCIGGAAAGSSAKALLRSDDGAETWRTVSAVADITRPTPDWTISRAEPSALAPGSPSRLWAAWQNGFSESEDGGSRWRNLWIINPQGFPCAFSVLSPTRAWLLAAGAALWRTADGTHWRLVNAFSPEEVTFTR